MRKLDRDVELQATRRKCFVYRLAVDDADGLGQCQNLRLSVESRQSRIAERIEERAGAAVEDWRLRTVHLDKQVVDAERRHRGQHVLDGVDRGITAPKLGAALARGHLAHGCPYRWGTGQIDALERYPRTGRGREESEPALLAKMQARAFDRRGLRDGETAHAPFRSSSSFSSLFIIPAILNSAPVARNDSRCGRAGYPDQTSPAGTLPKTPDWPPIRAPSPTVMWPPSPACPARTHPSPMRADPAIPTCAMMRQSRPTLTLCPIWTRLSIFVPDPIVVSSMLPRSMVVFAPISTSSPMMHLPT